MFLQAVGTIIVLAVLQAAHTEDQDGALASAQIICPYAACTCSGREIDCSGRMFSSPPHIEPNYRPGQLTTLDLSNNKITTLKQNMLIGNLTHLDLRDNPIQLAYYNAFDNMADTLKVLKLKSPHVKTVLSFLGRLNVLESLEFSYVNILSWRPDIWNSLGDTLRRIDITRTGILEWPHWIHSLPFLQEIQMGHNEIGVIPRYAFQEWRSQLLELHIPTAGIVAVDFLTELNALQKLDLSGNQIKNDIFLTYNLVSVQQSLTYLNLEGNHLSTPPRLAGAAKLDYLNLSGNNIATTDFASFPVSLKYLSLDGNKFNAMPEGIHYLKNLLTLTIRKNSITMLNGGSFPTYPDALVALHLDDNPISHIHFKAFNNVKNLQTLTMSNTLLDRLPMAIIPLKSLNLLSLQNIPNLLCQCDDMPIFTWFNATMERSVTIQGNCDNKPIVEIMDSFNNICHFVGQ